MAAGHLRLEQRADDEVIHFQCAVHDFLALERRQGIEPIHSHVKEIEGDGKFNIGGVEQTEFSVERLTRGKKFKIGKLFNQLMLAIEHDNRTFVMDGAFQILRDQILQGRCFASAGSRDDPVVRHPQGLRNRDWQRDR